MLGEIRFTSCQTSIIQIRMSTSLLPRFWKNHVIYLGFGLGLSVATLFGRVRGMLVQGAPGEKRRQEGLSRHITLAANCLQRISKHPAWPKGIFHDFHPHRPRPFKWTLILKASPNFRTLLFAAILDHKPLAWAWHPPGTSSSKPGVRQLFCKG